MPGAIIAQVMRTTFGGSHETRPIRFYSQTRLMELAGVAAEISDLRARRPGSRYPRREHLVDHSTAPLDLSGCVGEGTPAEVMVEEALSLWVGITHASFGAHASTRAEEDVSLPKRQSSLKRLDDPVLKAIFCASDAIRVRLARSLLEVCEDDDLSLCGSSPRGSRNGAAAKSEPVLSMGSADDSEKASAACGGMENSAGTRLEGVGENEETSERLPTTALTPARVETPERENFVGELRTYVVRLLLDNIPRAKVMSVSAGKLATEVSGTPGGAQPATEPGSREQNLDCTQLFHVLCALVGMCIKVSLRAVRILNIPGHHVA